MPARSNSMRGKSETRDSSKYRLALKSGFRAEQIAVLSLRLKGYRILALRFSIKGGEIDIIARRGTTIAFVEVKMRPTLSAAMMAIDSAKHRRMSCAARYWLATHPWAARLTLRGDAVYVVPWRWPRHSVAVIPLDLG
jgi:putative endonuclease